MAQQKDRVLMLDTTLRDGKQAPGNNIGPEDSLRVAHQLADLGVDIIEAGFAASNESDFATVQRVAAEVPAIVCSLTRPVAGDVEASVRALAGAKVSPRIHIFIGTSDIHVQDKLRMSRDEVLEKSVAAIIEARKHLDWVQFSTEDATRTDFEYLKLMVREAIIAGARVINLPDTVGWATPDRYANVFTRIQAAVPEIAEYKVRLSAHCHNDLGMATANSLAAVKSGARQVEGTILGIGERAGNTDLATVAMALQVHTDEYQTKSRIHTKAIGPTARLLSNVIEKPIPDNQPLVGRNVFAHGSGIHAAGVLRNRATYEFLNPTTVGWSGDTFPLAEQSGRAGLKERLQVLGFHVGENQIPELMELFQTVAAGRREVPNEDLYMLVQLLQSHDFKKHQRITVRSMSYRRAKSGMINASVSMGYSNRTYEGKAKSDSGPLNALWLALKDAFAHSRSLPLSDIHLHEYHEVGVGGTDVSARARVTLAHEQDGVLWFGHGYANHPDIVEAGFAALVMALNHVIHAPTPPGLCDVK